MFLCLSAFVFFNQELSKPGAQTWWSGETYSHSEKLDDDENVQVTTETQWCTQHSDTESEVCYINLQPLYLGEESTPVYHGIH